MKAKHVKTLRAICETPTRSNIAFADIESLIDGLGGAVLEREGSRVAFVLNGRVLHLHRPHPGREARKWHVESVRAYLETNGVKPE